MPGRKQASEWKEVLISADKKTVKCIYCSSQFSKKIEHVRNHLKACKWKKNAEIEEDVEKNPTEKLDLDIILCYSLSHLTLLQDLTSIYILLLLIFNIHAEISHFFQKTQIAWVFCSGFFGLGFLGQPCFIKYIQLKKLKSNVLDSRIPFKKPFGL